VTVEVYTLSLKEHTKLKGLLEVVSSSAEFETILIRRHEDALLRRIYDRVPVKLERADLETPHFKTFLLLQAHFLRLQLPHDLAADQVLALSLSTDARDMDVVLSSGIGGGAEGRVPVGGSTFDFHSFVLMRVLR